MTVRSFPTEASFPEPKTLEKKISKGFRAQKEERFEYPLSPVVINTERGERRSPRLRRSRAREESKAIGRTISLANSDEGRQ